MIRQNRKYNVANVKGFTLVEVLVVVIIIGVLSSMGVVGLQGAVQNNRIKDAGINVAAFVAQVANEANRLSSKVCMKVDGDQTLKAYKGACSDEKLGDQVAEMSLESLNKFVTSGLSGFDGCSNIFGPNNSATFVPRLGLSSTPTGCLVVRYGNTDKVAIISKVTSRNAVFYKLSYDKGSSWSEF